MERLEKGSTQTIRAALMQVAEPVAASARQRISAYAGARTNTIRPKATGVGTVYVRQNARKRTGKRPDFGSLQMRKGLIPALGQNEERIERGLESALDQLIGSNF